MTAYTDFHYSPTGSGVISGAQVLEQTEQGINGLGQYVQDNVSGAIDTANEALTTARSADSNATTAINLANSFNAQIIAANQTAGNALTTAQSAQNTANSASSLATTADNNAATALNAANAASAGVTTLTGTVNSLGNRMTAAENAINTNAGNITTLQNNLATTNANVTAAANAASAAQATATSAQSTATQARNQAYVLRYTGTTITGGGTIAYADIDNTDNIKAGDKIIDATGAVYAIASVDIANETVTVSASEIINLAVLPDLFNSGNTWSANNEYTYLIGLNGAEIWFKQQNIEDITANPDADISKSIIQIYNKTVTQYSGGIADNLRTDGSHRLMISCFGFPLNNYAGYYPHTFYFEAKRDGTASFSPSYTNASLGTSTNKWKTLNGVNPGALSLPATTYSDIDTTDWVLTGAAFNYTPVLDGWVEIHLNANANDVNRISVDNVYYRHSTESAAGRKVMLTFPVRANQSYELRLWGASIAQARFVKCEGNV